MPVPTTSLKTLARPAVLGAAVAAMAMPAAAGAASVAPEYVAGNPSCEDLGLTTILKDDGANGGQFSENGWDIEIVKDGLSFDWSASKGVRVVIVKGGDNANVYAYAQTALGDSDLFAPTNPQNDTPYGLSHIEFCDGDVDPQPDPDPDPDPRPDPDPKPDPDPTPDPDPQPQPEPQPPAQPQAPVQPAVQFTAAQKAAAPLKAIAASSRVAAPSSCVTRTFRVSVNGRGMRSVTFYVNGRKVATKKGSRRVSVRVPVTSSVHRIRAKVRYVSGATRTTQTLRAATVRCLQRVVRPQFTG